MNLRKWALLPLFSALLLTSCGNEGTRYDVAAYKAGEISVNSSGGIKILQLCDIHLSNKDNIQLQLDFMNLTVQDAKNQNVDLIVLDGDLFTFADKSTAKTLFDWVDSYGIPWTCTFGNHDEQAYFSVSWLTDYLNNYGHNCIFKDIQDDDLTGHANFYIDVKNGSSVFERIYVLDSNRYHFSTDYMGYDYIRQNQIDWYERCVNQTTSAESLAFFHIPFEEFETAWKKYKDGDPSVTYLGGSEGESTSCPKVNTKFYDKMVELGSTKGVFCGHDHENDYAVKYNGIVLSYGTNSTDRIYSDPEKTGGQIITLSSTHELTLERIHHYYSEVEGK